MKASLSSIPFFAFIVIILMQKMKVVEKIELKLCYLATYMYLLVCRKLCSVDSVAASIFQTIWSGIRTIRSTLLLFKVFFLYHYNPITYLFHMNISKYCTILNISNYVPAGALNTYWKLITLAEKLLNLEST